MAIKKEISSTLKKFGVRFHNNKSKYIIKARKKFSSLVYEKIIKNNKNKNSKELRDFLVENIKGIGYKEASHFLRNIGLGGKNLAILDRHILKNLIDLKVIKEKEPKSISSRKKYLEIEKKMLTFSKKIRILMDELDLLFWAKETGEVFK